MVTSELQNNFSHTRERPDTGNPEMGRKIREFRLLKGLRQQDLGDKVSISHQQIQKYEAGITNRQVMRNSRSIIS